MGTDDSATEFLRTVGQRLRDAREAKGATLQQAADRLSLKTRATVGHWEKGLNPIDLSKLYRLARYYETSVAALIAPEPSLEGVMADLKRIRDTSVAPPAAQPTSGKDLAGIPHFKPGKAAPKQSKHVPAVEKVQRAGKRPSDAAPKRRSQPGK